MVIETLGPVIAWMRSQGVRRLRLIDGLEVELEPGAPAGRVPVTVPVADERPAPIALALEDVDGAGVCSCGHSWLEHNGVGCLRGCSEKICTSTGRDEVDR